MHFIENDLCENLVTRTITNEGYYIDLRESNVTIY